MKNISVYGNNIDKCESLNERLNDAFLNGPTYVKLKDLKMDLKQYSIRTKLDYTTVEVYRKRILSNTPLPILVVGEIGSDNVLIDGYHRTATGDLDPENDELLALIVSIENFNEARYLSGLFNAKAGTLQDKEEVQAMRESYFIAEEQWRNKYYKNSLKEFSEIGEEWGVSASVVREFIMDYCPDVARQYEDTPPLPIEEYREQAQKNHKELQTLLKLDRSLKDADKIIRSLPENSEERIRAKESVQLLMKRLGTDKAEIRKISWQRSIKELEKRIGYRAQRRRELDELVRNDYQKDPDFNGFIEEYGVNCVHFEYDF